MRTTPARRTALAAVVAGAAVLALAGPAAAHVTVHPGSVPQGGYTAVAFRVPDESETAATTGLKLQLPTDHPLAGVLVSPLPGWSATIKQTTLADPIKTDDGDISQVVSEIDWTAAAGAGIKPGYFGQFTFIAGQLPDGVDQLTFKAVQRYSDGSSTAWIEESAPGSDAEPEHPAPVLKLATAGAAKSGSAQSGAAQSGSGVTVTAGSTDGASKGAATTGIVLGAIGAVLGATALVLVLMRRGPRAG